jgi:hypothetical protein
MRSYLDGAGPFPARAHLVVLLAGFAADFAETMLDWCDRAEAEIESWPEIRDVGLTDASRARLAALIQRHDRRLRGAS